MPNRKQILDLTISQTKCNCQDGWIVGKLELCKLVHITAFIFNVTSQTLGNGRNVILKK